MSNPFIIDVDTITSLKSSHSTYRDRKNFTVFHYGSSGPPMVHQHHARAPRGMYELRELMNLSPTIKGFGPTAVTWADGTALTLPTINTFTCFSDLPAEIQLEIFQYVLHSPFKLLWQGHYKTKHQNHDHRPKKLQSSSIISPLLVSRAMYQLAAPIFYIHNRFRTDVFSGPPLTFESPIFLAKIRHLTITFKPRYAQSKITEKLVSSRISEISEQCPGLTTFIIDIPDTVTAWAPPYARRVLRSTRQRVSTFGDKFWEGEFRCGDFTCPVPALVGCILLLIAMLGVTLGTIFVRGHPHKDN